MRTNEELATAIQAGEREVIEKLWVQCYGFVCLCANKWARAWQERPSFDADDFIQSGYIALCEAVKAYQADKGTFITLLAYYLKKEFAKVAGCRTTAQMHEPINNAVRLDAPAGNDESGELTTGDTIPVDEPGFEEVEDAIYKAYMRRVVKDAIYSLPERQRIAIEAHYLDGKTYGEIAALLDVSQGRAGQLVKRGLHDLRNGKHAPTLSELLWNDRNLYKHTGFTAWKETGCSVQEWSMLWMERETGKHQLSNTRAAKIRYCVEVRGMDRERAEQLFPA